MKVRNPSWLAASSGGIIVTLALGASLASAAPPDRIPPTTPTNLRVTGTSDYSVSLAWNASTDNSGSWYYKLVSSAGVTVNVDRTRTSHSFTTGHAAGSTYLFYVYAVDGRGNRSPNSNTVTATLLPNGTLPSAPVVSATDVGPTHISLGWTVPFDAGPPVRYWVYWNGQLVSIGQQTTTFTVYYTEPQSTHSFTVQARDGRARFSPHSAVLSVTTPPSDPNDATPPTVPTNFWVNEFYDGSTEFEIGWTASTDNVTPQAWIRYDIYLNGEWLDSTVGSTHRTDYGEAGENTVELTATDEAGNVSAAATVTFNLPGA
jgi:hypothetical protein